MSYQAPDSSLSDETELSARSEALVALGKKLVAELGLDDSVDTLGRWMAHHIAELMKELEVATVDNRSTKQAQLRDAILALWAHRSELPNGKRPFGEFEPIFRALESLDPESQHSRYLSPFRAPEKGDEESKDAQQWVRLAGALDFTSKILIDHCLILAAEAALDNSKEWVELARSAGIDDSFEFAVIRIISDRSDLMKEGNPDARQRRILVDRKKRLEEFLSIVSTFVNELDARMESLPAPTTDDPDEILLTDLRRL